MTMADKLPTLLDQDLKVLLSNARRLEKDGTPKQQAAAAELAPLVEAEMAKRKPAPKPKAPPKPKVAKAEGETKPKAVRKPKAAKAEADADA